MPSGGKRSLGRSFDLRAKSLSDGGHGHRPSALCDAAGAKSIFRFTSNTTSCGFRGARSHDRAIIRMIALRLHGTTGVGDRGAGARMQSSVPPPANCGFVLIGPPDACSDISPPPSRFTSPAPPRHPVQCRARISPFLFSGGRASGPSARAAVPRQAGLGGCSAWRVSSEPSPN
jgi:hypothetical protein